MECESRQTTARAFLGWLALCVALLSSGVVVQSFGVQRGIDFYHYWGIPAARAFAGEEPLGTPYTNGPRYAGILNAHADASTDGHLARANAERRSIDPTGTPFFYACFAWLPLDFTLAHAWFRFGQWASLVIGLVWFARRIGIEIGPAAVFAAAAPAFFQPFHSDLSVGNVNAFQLLGCVALVALADVLRRRKDLLAGAGLASALVGFVVFKPNLAPIAAALALSLWSSLGAARAALAGALGLGFGALCVAASSAYFGGFAAWSEWYAFLSGPTGSKIADYSVLEGNYAASVVFVERAAHSDPAAWTYRISLGLGLALVASWLAAVAVGRRGRGWVARLREIGADADTVLVSALLLMLAASPLVWLHYCLLALIPILWCWRADTHVAFRRACALAALLAYGGLAAPHLRLVGLELADYAPYAAALAWIPLWAALLLELARPAPR